MASNPLLLRCQSSAPSAYDPRTATADVPDADPCPEPVTDNVWTNSRFFKAFVGLIVYLIVGVPLYICISNGFGGKSCGVTAVDALYFLTVTMTTIGYGDIAPATKFSKAYTCLAVIAGLAMFDMVLSGAVVQVLENQDSRLKILLSTDHESLSSGDNDDGNDAHDSSSSETQSGSSLGTFVSTVLRHCKAFLGLGKIDKTGRMKAVLAREEQDARRKVWHAFLRLNATILLGAVVLSFSEGMNAFDAVYCAFISASTVGYGDESFSSVFGRCFACMWLVLGTVSFGHFFFTLSDLRSIHHQVQLANWVFTRKTTRSDLITADLDHDMRLSISEFVVLKMKELGRIKDWEMSLIYQEFRKLDVDGNGYLDSVDLKLKMKHTTWRMKKASRFPSPGPVPMPEMPFSPNGMLQKKGPTWNGSF